MPVSRVGLSIGAVLVLALVGVGNCLAATTDQVERRTSMCQIVKTKPSVGDLWIRLRAVYISDVTEGTVLKDPHCPRQRLELGKPLTETEDKSVACARVILLARRRASASGLSLLQYFDLTPEQKLQLPESHQEIK